MYVTILVRTWPAQDTIKPNYYSQPKCLPTTHRHVDIVPHKIEVVSRAIPPTQKEREGLGNRAHPACIG